MSLPVTPSLLGLAWYLIAQAPSREIYSTSFISFSSILQSLPIAHSTLISLAKWAFGFTSVHYLSSELTAFARNNWRLSDAHRWNWKEEVAVVTGGCSGIGEEMVKALGKKGVKVVILDVTDLPERLQGGE
jgi:3-oxoacyl-ACP reductase-like protein